MTKRPDRSRPLPRPLIIPGVMTLRKLADVRKLIALMPKEFRDRSTWRSVEAQLKAAAASADTKDVLVALELVLMLEKVEFRLK